MPNSIDKVLAVETSCDDSSVAIVSQSGWVHSCESMGQDNFHKIFGGIVPEIASRNHVLNILPLVELCLEKAKMTFDDIDGLAVTNRPGLIGSLMVGVVCIKTLAACFNKPFVGVHHHEGHVLSPFLKDSEYSPPEEFKFPYLCLTVSGGHSSIYLVEKLGEYKLIGKSIDDAAGEAFDKFAKMVGLNYPGGPLVDKLARSGNPKAFDFPRPMLKDKGFNMSFSGLKTAALNAIDSNKIKTDKGLQADLCASYQQAIIDVLLTKLTMARQRLGIDRVAIVGGVSANSALREQAKAWAESEKVVLSMPPLRYCTDNAAMIGYAGLVKLLGGQKSDSSLPCHPRAELHLGE